MERMRAKMRELRRARRWSQQKMANFLHVDRTTYTKYESGAASPSIESILELCRALNVSPNELLDWESRNKDK